MKRVLLVFLLALKAVNVLLFLLAVLMGLLALVAPYSLPPDPWDSPADHAIWWYAAAIPFVGFLLLTFAVIRPLDRHLKAAGV